MTILLALACRRDADFSVARVDWNAGVSIPLAIDGAPSTPEERAGPIPPGRDGWVLVHLDLARNRGPIDLDGTLEIRSPSGAVRDFHRSIHLDESTADWASDPDGGYVYGGNVADFGGLAFSVPGERIEPGAAWRLELDGGRAGRLEVPADAWWTLPVEREPQVIRIELQPIDLKVEGCDRSPDLSDEAMAPLLARLEDEYPLSSIEGDPVEITRAPPIEWTDLPLSRNDMLMALVQSRAERKVAPQIYTYGMVDVCDGIAPPAPLGGAISELLDPPTRKDAEWVAAVLTLGKPMAFSGDGDYREYVFVHELAHLLGRVHAPCGNPNLPDPNYPFPEGTIGEWGLDPASGRLYHPELAHDLMAYCQEMWLSPYTWTGLWERMAEQSAELADRADARVEGDPVEDGPDQPVLLGLATEDTVRWRVAARSLSAPDRRDGVLVLDSRDGERTEPVAVGVSPDGATLLTAPLPPDLGPVRSARVSVGASSWAVDPGVLP